MFIGVSLGIPQCLLVNDVELDMVAVQFEVATHELEHLVDVLITLEDAGKELLVQQGSTGSGVIYLGC